MLNWLLPFLHFMEKPLQPVKTCDMNQLVSWMMKELQILNSTEMPGASKAAYPSLWTLFLGPSLTDTNLDIFLFASTAREHLHRGLWAAGWHRCQQNRPLHSAVPGRAHLLAVQEPGQQDGPHCYPGRLPGLVLILGGSTLSIQGSVKIFPGRLHLNPRRRR